MKSRKTRRQGQGRQAVVQEGQERQEKEGLDSSRTHSVCIHDYDIVLYNSELNFYGGKIANCYDAWKQLTSDKWILQVVQGFEIEFDSRPFQHFQPHPLRLGRSDKRALETALQGFLVQGIIEHCEADDALFVSTVFPVMKRDGSARIILNLSDLNEFVTNYHFKMDTIRDAIAMMRPGCFFASIDFKHAYYSVLVDEDSRRYLCFLWKNEMFRFTVLPQGLSSSPRSFTKLLKPALAYLRGLGHVVMIYIDDSLFVSDCSKDCRAAISEALTLFDRLGLTVSLKKSIIQPVQRIEFLGFILDSVHMSIELTQSKKDKIQNLGSQLMKRARIQIRDLAEFIGNVVAAEPGVAYAPLYYKGLEITRNKLLRRYAGNYEAWFKLRPRDVETISWWVDHVQSSFKMVSQSSPDHVTESDASTKGWGCHFQGHATGGDWSAEEAESHINVLELKAAFLTLQTFCTDFRRCHVRLMMDNTTAIACINKMESTSSELFEVTKQVYEWAIPREITLSAAHIPGVENVVADRESRTHNIDTEWKLRESIFAALCEKLGTPQIDLFASRLNHQLDRYVSWRPDPGAIAIDALSMSWGQEYMYAFPPFSIITQVLEKLEREGGAMILVIPTWPTKPWFPMIGRLLAAAPIRLPRQALYLPQLPQKVHPLEDRLRLLACPLYGTSMNLRDSHLSLSTFWSPPGGRGPRFNTRCICGSGCHFVKQNKYLCSVPL